MLILDLSNTPVHNGHTNGQVPSNSRETISNNGSNGVEDQLQKPSPQVNRLDFYGSGVIKERWWNSMQIVLYSINWDRIFFTPLTLVVRLVKFDMLFILWMLNYDVKLNITLWRIKHECTHSICRHSDAWVVQMSPCTTAFRPPSTVTSHSLVLVRSRLVLRAVNLTVDLQVDIP